MNRLLLTGAIGIAFLTAVGLGAVVLLDRATPAAAALAPGPAAPASAPDPPPPPPPPPLPPLPPRPAPAASPPQSAPPPTTEASPPEQAPQLQAASMLRLKAFGPLRRDTQAGLEALADEVRACRLPDAAITLTLETLEGRVRVAAVSLRPAGASAADVTGVTPAPLDENGVRCVTSALQGRTFDARSARPGRRWEMPWKADAAP